VTATVRRRFPIYDGAPYSLVFDRLLRGVHRRVAERVPGGSRCLDVCCGTGGLTFQLAQRCTRVVGIDHSPAMISRAETLRIDRGFEHVAFRVADATGLGGLSRSGFDVAVVAMGLHEMPAVERARVLPGLLGIVRRVVIVDFAVPMPGNLAGIRNRGFELIAGPRHYAGFRDYTRRGGLPPLVEDCGATVVFERSLDRGTLTLMEIAAR
jgi:demethylmenaquinone methyltransferase/2-methoxy-6-polyprenyl-1,4-benzoquinol methylase